jgi:hypothetical protein
VILHEQAKALGKEIKFVVQQDEKLKSLTKVKEALNIK